MCKIVTSDTFQIESFIDHISWFKVIEVNFIFSCLEFFFEENLWIFLSKRFNNHITLNSLCSIPQKQSHMRKFVINLYSLSIRTICANYVSWNVDDEIHFQSSLLIVFKRLKVFVLLGVEFFCVSSQVESGDMVVVRRRFERFLEVVDIIVDEMIQFLLGV